MKRCFEKNGAAKDFDFKQKKSIWKKKLGVISSWGIWPSTRDDPLFFWPPEKFHFMSVILSPCLFPVINPKTGDGLRENWNPQKKFQKLQISQL